MSKTDSQNQVSLSFDRGTLLLTGLTRKELPDACGSCVWRWDTRVGAWRCDAIYYAVICKALLEQFGADFSDEVMKPAVVSWPKIELPKLRPEQTEALAAWSQADCCGQVIMPTENRAAEKLRVLEDIFRLHKGQQILVFAGSNIMAIEVSRRFLVPTILSHTRKRERLAVLGGFANGQFEVLVANRVLDEGVDVPEAKVAVVIGGQSSTRQAKQRLGRVLRRTGSARATLYEVICENTKEVHRSRKRRKSDAYERTIHSRV